jgi:hypothetical protein
MHLVATYLLTIRLCIQSTFTRFIHQHDTLIFILYSSNIYTIHKSIYEGRWFVLFCSYEIHRTGMLRIMFLVSLESSQRGGVHGLGSMTLGLVVQKFLNIE